MDDKQFDTELKKLLNDASDKAPISDYCESVEQERRELVTAFYDHYATLSLFENGDSVEDFLKKLNSTAVDSPEDDDGGLPSMIHIDLDELIQKDLEKYPILLDGEMQVSGEGIYIIEIDSQSQHDDSEIDILEGGATLTGDIESYSVGPMISYEAFVRTQHADELDRPDYDDVPNEVPTLLLHMKNVKVIDESGEQTKILNEVTVPMNYPSFQFGKIVHQNTYLAPEINDQQQSVDIITHFKSDFIVGIYNEIERELNSGNSEGKALHALRAKYQEEIAVYMDVVNKDRKILLTALDVLTHTGKFIDITDQEIVYLDPVIVQLVDQSWRVVHAVEISTRKGLLLCHVLPEDILDIRYRIEE